MDRIRKDFNDGKYGLYLMGFLFVLNTAGTWIMLTFLMYNYLVALGIDYTVFGVIGISTILGGLIWGKLFSRVQNPLFFSIFAIPLGVCFIGFYFLESLVLIVILLLLTGLFAVFSFIGSLYYLKRVIHLESRGKSFGLLIFFSGCIIIFNVVTMLSLPAKDFFLFVGTPAYFIAGGVGVFLWLKQPITEPIEKSIGIDTSITPKDLIYYLIAIFLFTFTMGIQFWQSIASPLTHDLTVQAGSYIIGDLAYTGSGLEAASLYITIGILMSSIPAGFLIDRIGRREMWLAAFICFCVSVTLLGLFFTIYSVILSWILEGVGFAILLNCLSVTFSDLPDDQSRAYIGVVWSIFIFGIISGTAVGMVATTLSFTYITIIILFTFSIAIFSILHAKETLPSKEERSWQECIQHLFLIHANGVCIIHYPFIEQEIIDRDLLAGGLTGIIALIQEMTKSAEKTEVISQKDSKMILKYGNYSTVALISSEDLKILHKKLSQFISDFENLFQDFLIEWFGNIDAFKPAERLISRYFMEKNK